MDVNGSLDSLAAVSCTEWLYGAGFIVADAIAALQTDFANAALTKHIGLAIHAVLNVHASDWMMHVISMYIDYANDCVERGFSSDKHTSLQASIQLHTAVCFGTFANWRAAVE